MLRPEPLTPLAIPRWKVAVVFVAPLISALLAAAVVGIQPVALVACGIAAVVPILVARTFVINLPIRLDRSWLRAEPSMLFRDATPRWYERGYAPLLTAVLAGAGVELVHTLLEIAPLRGETGLGVVLASVVLGVLEGMLVVLSGLLGWALASLIVARHSGRAV